MHLAAKKIKIPTHLAFTSADQINYITSLMKLPTKKSPKKHITKKNILHLENSLAVLHIIGVKKNNLRKKIDAKKSQI